MVAAIDRFALKNEMIAQDLKKTIGAAARHVINAFGLQGNAQPSGPVDESQDPPPDALPEMTLDGVPVPAIPPIDPPGEVQASAPDDAERVIAWLNAVYALPRYATSSVMWARACPSAEYAFRLWAGGHNLKLQETHTPVGTGVIRVLTIWDRNFNIVAQLQWPQQEVN